ncbi:MAG: hypothetical protein LBV41_06300 [Cytophagaceae bacterium]|jgi:hypothetical protein|nr:hypothetical protein [Cytophagaceae bacterium]
MKKKVIISSVKLFCAAALLFGAVVFGACADDSKECKTCTNSVTKETFEACGDELDEAELLPSVTCQ